MMPHLTLTTTLKRAATAAALLLLSCALCACSDDKGGNEQQDAAVGQGDASTADGGAQADAGACGGSKVRPSARSEMVGIFDPQRRKLFFFGGDDGEARADGA